MKKLKKTTLDDFGLTPTLKEVEIKVLRLGEITPKMWSQITYLKMPGQQKIDPKAVEAIKKFFIAIKNITSRTDFRIAIAKKENKIVSAIGVSTSNDKKGIMHRLATKPEEMGKGYAKKVLKAAYQWAITKGGMKDVVYTPSFNPAAKATFEMFQRKKPKWKVKALQKKTHRRR